MKYGTVYLKHHAQGCRKFHITHVEQSRKYTLEYTEKAGIFLAGK